MLLSTGVICAHMFLQPSDTIQKHHICITRGQQTWVPYSVLVPGQDVRQCPARVRQCPRSPCVTSWSERCRASCVVIRAPWSTHHRTRHCVSSLLHLTAVNTGHGSQQVITPWSSANAVFKPKHFPVTVWTKLLTQVCITHGPNHALHVVSAHVRQGMTRYDKV